MTRKEWDMSNMGLKMRDKITGFTGVVTGYVQYISGCNQMLLAPKANKEGGFVESQWFDEQRMETVEGERVVLDNGDTPGSDRAAPRR